MLCQQVYYIERAYCPADLLSNFIKYSTPHNVTGSPSYIDECSVRVFCYML